MSIVSVRFNSCQKKFFKLAYLHCKAWEIVYEMFCHEKEIFFPMRFDEPCRREFFFNESAFELQKALENGKHSSHFKRCILKGACCEFLIIFPNI